MQGETHDVFLSYSSQDAAWARAALRALEESGLRCWMAPRDIVGGRSWAGAIVEAIEGCRVMVLIFSRHANESDQVTRELAQAAQVGVPTLPLRIEDFQPSKDKAFYLTAAHWLDVFGGPTPESLERLTRDVRALLDPGDRPVPRSVPARGRRRGRRSLLVFLGSAALLAAAWLPLRRLVVGLPEKGEPTEAVRAEERLASRVAEPQGPRKEGPAVGRAEPSAANQALPSASEPPPVPSPWGDAPGAMREAFEPLDELRSDGGHELPTRIRHVGTGIEMVYVPGGTFELGTPPDPWRMPRGMWQSDEHPTRDVRVTGFYMAVYETTVGQWTGRPEGSLQPVTNVRYEEVSAWCEARGLLLPTEVQWEYAASGPENLEFPWGGDEDWDPGRCNAVGASGGDVWARETAPVGSFGERGTSWCGVQDLAGNVYEWCRGSYAGYEAFSEGADPEPPPDGSQRVARGGSWNDRQRNCRTGDRRPFGEHVEYGYVGFRCVYEPF